MPKKKKLQPVWLFVSISLVGSTSGKRAPLRAIGKRSGIHDNCECDKHEFFDRLRHNVASVGIYTKYYI